MTQPTEHDPDTPDYYIMYSDVDVFAWACRQPFPQALRTAPDAVGLFGCWFTALRYALRCLWKSPHRHGMAADARKAARSFVRLAELLEAHQTEREPSQS